MHAGMTITYANKYLEQKPLSSFSMQY